MTDIAKPEEGMHVPDTVALLEAQAKRIDYLEHVVDHLRARLGSSLEHADHLLKRHLKMEEALEKIIKKAKASGHEKIVKKAEAILEDYDD